ncbi:hypothetical protein T11_2846 [Trichinella zimbabwensis]|uniref:Uncharacterized protein n=1 Tax=Trichinella zimbabwensis TaxID=268475 RepID=A0A0V1I587_9BILA|nr:hypothetical protein T11_2846 [Trichinella zimbabwensis]
MSYVKLLYSVFCSHLFVYQPLTTNLLTSLLEQFLKKRKLLQKMQATLNETDVNSGQQCISRDIYL